MGSEYEKKAENILDEKYRELLILYLKERWGGLLKKLSKEEMKKFKKLKLSQRFFYKYLRIVDGLSHVEALKKCKSGF